MAREGRARKRQLVTNNIIMQYVLDEKRSSENCEFYFKRR